MPFGLTIGTERASALQHAIGEELMKRGYSADNDEVMAEYIIIMIINNKSPDVISGELEDLIGSEFDRSFTDWLFAEAAKGAPESELFTQTQTQSSDTTQPSPPASSSVREAPPHAPADGRRPPPSGPRGGAPLYQQALSQALPNPSPTAQKRSASARSPSPTGQGPSKSRRTDIPAGPRAMREGRHGGPSAPRSLLERVGGPAGRPNHNGPARNDDIQSRIDNITGSPMGMDMQAAMAAGFVPPGMDMNAMAAAQMGANPLLLQEMMMNQMAMMAQMATSLGMLNPVNGQFNGFPMQGGPQDMAMYGPGGFQGAPPGDMGGRGRGRGRGGFNGRGRGGGRASSPRLAGGEPATAETETSSTTAPEVTVAAPVPTPVPATSQPTARIPFAVPDRPQSPTLCKFGLKCTNAHCRWSHPSPVATPESGVVLSNEACEQGKDCKDKDCIKAHVSPAAANPDLAVEQPKSKPKPHVPAPPPPQSHVAVPCRYGANCTRRDCQFQHPPAHRASHHASQQQQQQQQPCRFGAGCTRANCAFQHPEGRVLPSSFHRGLSATGPIVNVSTPQTGSMGGPSPHRSVVFNNPKAAQDGKTLEEKVRKVEEEKQRAVQAVKEAEEAAAKKEGGAKPSVAIAV
ncbi:hypothetical protein FA95DRAFT_1563829 [Auriscalpium vulgare]|uniref:Uncharacterized protein n=1 Tax=Auriscalpium vulgare TaxID=40419 RepID=A0ACB8RF98_9AGAM|nr:hypothetical protein FA95DRAFT_1563829 [Auriscalpium vulgare]